MSHKKAKMHPEQPHSRCAEAAKREYYKNANVAHLPTCTKKFEDVWVNTQTTSGSRSYDKISSFMSLTWQVIFQICWSGVFPDSRFRFRTKLLLVLPPCPEFFSCSSCFHWCFILLLVRWKTRANSPADMASWALARTGGSGPLRRGK